jgi:hypothetical protein
MAAVDQGRRRNVQQRKESSEINGNDPSAVPFLGSTKNEKR